MKFEIEQYVFDNLKNAKEVQANKGEGEMTAECPSCEKYGGFYINTESGAHLCNKCPFRGKSVIGLVALIEDISWSDARAYIFERSVKLRRKQDILSLLDRVRMLRPDADDDEEDEGPVDFELPDRFTPIFRSKREPKWRIPTYLKGRKLKSKTLRAWGMGYCPKGDYADRLIIPIECPNGKSWTARAMSDDVWGPKYLNPPGADHSHLLIGWNVARVTGDLVICEGPLDAVRLYQNDVSAVAVGGHELHDSQLAMLMRLSPDSAVTIMLDPEETVRPYDFASALSVHFKWIYIASLPDDVDPGDATKRQVHKALDDAKRWTGSRAPRLRQVLAKARKSAEKRYS